MPVELDTIRRLEHEGRVYIDLGDLEKLCALIAQVKIDHGFLAGALVVEDFAKVLALVLG